MASRDGTVMVVERDTALTAFEDHNGITSAKPDDPASEPEG